MTSTLASEEEIVGADEVSYPAADEVLAVEVAAIRSQTTHLPLSESFGVHKSSSVLHQSVG